MTPDPKATPAATDEEIRPYKIHPDAVIAPMVARKFIARIEADREKIATLEADNAALKAEAERLKIMAISAERDYAVRVERERERDAAVAKVVRYEDLIKGISCLETARNGRFCSGNAAALAAAAKDIRSEEWEAERRREEKGESDGEVEEAM